MPSRDALPNQNPKRLLALTIAFAAIGGVRAASAQTVIVRSAPAGATVELTTEAGSVATATADNLGDATLKAPAQAADVEGQVFVDVCGSRVNVLLVRLRPTAAAPAGCIRTDIGSVFIVRPITTFVIDLDGTSATAHVTQGPPPREWLQRGAATARPSRIHWGRPQNGLALSAGLGVSSFNRAVGILCGDVSRCESSNFGGATQVSAEYWVKRFVAAHASYVSPADVTVHGTSDTYRFDSNLHARLLTLGAKLGGAVGPARLYGIGGFTRHESTSTTTQTQDATTVMVGGVTQTIPGGTQSFAQKSTGWSYVFGGGVEAWFFRWAAFYGEVNIAKVKGKPTTGGEGGIDDRVFLAVAGARVRIGR
jgi:hypothetical protein